MQRITEKDQAVNVLAVSGGDLRRDSPTHRLAADNQPIALQFLVLDDRVDDRAITCFQARCGVGNLAALLGVKKIESDNVESAFGQAAREQTHKAAQLVRARAVAENDGHADAI